MWIYPDRLGKLIPRGLRPIAPCLLSLLGRRVVIAIMRFWSQGPDCRSFRFSHAHVLTLGSTVKLLVSCLGCRFARHGSGS